MKMQMTLLTVVAITAGACSFHAKVEKEVPPSQINKPEDSSTPRSKVLTPEGRGIMNDPKFIESLKKIEAGNKVLGQEAEAGSVIFSGVIAKEEQEKVVTDKHILINPESSLNLTRVMGEEELTVMEDVTDLKTFINIGCKLGPAQTEGLTEIKVKSQNGFLHAHANKIFMCGAGAATDSNVIVYANELVMNGVSRLFSKADGIVNICAKTLTLIGQNQILSTIKEPNSLNKPGSPVFVSVVEKIKGEGTLQINQ